MKKGDFTNLAEDYAKYRPSYNNEIVKYIAYSAGNNIERIKAADVGAGTGIFTKCLINEGIKDVIAIEPNEQMQKAGMTHLGKDVKFINGSAEDTRLKSDSVELVSMASSFHWANTNQALKEFNRILKSNGIFSAIWNPRITERSAIERQIQELLVKKYKLVSRVSSGCSGITTDLEKILTESGIFRSVVYLEATDLLKRTPEEYIGAWRSVNDVQAQLGEDKFSQFIEDVEQICNSADCVDVHYRTRAWVARKN